jgi:predicted Zn-dependent peptidase
MPLISGVFNELAGTLSDKEIERNKTQLKAGLMMGLESTTARCEQLANHMLTHGKPLTPQDIISKVDIVSSDDILTMASKLFSSEPTFAAVGPGDLKTHLVL